MYKSKKLGNFKVIEHKMVSNLFGGQDPTCTVQTQSSKQTTNLWGSLIGAPSDTYEFYDTVNVGC